MAEGRRTTTGAKAPADKQDDHTHLLRFMQAMDIGLANQSLNRADVRAWTNRVFPQAELALEKDLAPWPDEEDEPVRSDFSAGGDRDPGDGQWQDGGPNSPQSESEAA